MEISKTSPLPRHFQLGEAIKRDIIKRGLAVGDPIPSERLLSEEYNVSRVTVRRTIAGLVDEGVLRREGRKGTFVGDVSRINVWQPSGRRRLWGVVIPDIEDFFAARLVSGTEDCGHDLGYSIALSSSDEDRDRAAKQIERMVDEDVAGIMLIPIACDNYVEVNTALLNDIRSHGIPVVLVDRYIEGSGVDTVVSDNFDGGYRETQHLIDLGHKRIAFVGYPNCSSVLDRIAGYKKCLMDNGILPDSRLIIQPHPRRDRARTIEVTREIMSLKPQITAICTANDGVATDVWAGITELGLKVPNDVALVGFDNAQGFVGPGAVLTTSEQPLREESRLAGRMLAERIDGYEGEARVIVLKTTFIPGISTGATQPEPLERAAAARANSPF